MERYSGQVPDFESKMITLLIVPSFFSAMPTVPLDSLRVALLEAGMCGLAERA